MCALVPGGFIVLGRHEVGWGMGNGVVVQAEGAGLVEGEKGGWCAGHREGREWLAVRCGWTGGTCQVVQGCGCDPASCLVQWELLLCYKKGNGRC